MKKQLTLAIAVLMMFSLAACGVTTPSQEQPSHSPVPFVSSGQAESSAFSDAADSAESESTESEGSSPQPLLKNDEQQTSSLPGEEVSQPQPSEDTPSKQEPTEEDIEMKLNVQVGAQTFSASLEDNAAVNAFVEMMKEAPVVIQMSDYSGFEKVGSLGTELPVSNSQTTTQAGDIVLYSGNQIVIFYGSNSWSYTRLGKIDNLSGWEEALGSGNVTVTFSIGG